MQKVNSLTDGEVVAIDGKILSSSYSCESRQPTIHLVSSFATANGVAMRQIKAEGKSNVITASPKLLNLLDIRYCDERTPLSDIQRQWC